MPDEKLERVHLDKFLNLFSEDLVGTIEKGEKPDFQIYSNEKIIGIEHTQLFRPSSKQPLQEIESLSSNIAKQAQNIYLTTGHPPVDVSILFNSKYHIRKNMISWLPQTISELVIKIMPKMGESLIEEYKYTNRSYFPEEIDFISISRNKETTESFFSAMDSAVSSRLGIDFIEEQIQRKNKKVNTYGKSCDELWLLLVSDGWRLSSRLKFDKSIDNHIYKCDFDRVFLLKNMKELVELK